MEKANNQVTVDSYIASEPKAVREILEQMRATIKAAAPEAEEVISYGMPAYKYHGMLVYFAAHTHHCGFYPGNSETITSTFAEELVGLDVSKGTIRFPFDKPIPFNLIKKIVAARVKQNEVKAAEKAAVKKVKKIK